MSQSFHIDGGYPLVGTISASGSKNASFPILAAIVLLSRPIIVTNLPNIVDIQCFTEILEKMGATITRLGANELLIDPTTITNQAVPAELGSRIRGSYYLLGALLARFHEATIPYPGGCDIGHRPMDLHVDALSKLGVTFTSDEYCLTGKWISIDTESTIIELPFPSRGATINLILACSLNLNSMTRIMNANSSPETNSLIDFLKQAGLEIWREGNDICVSGNDQLTLSEFSIIPDKIEVATLLSAGLITRGQVEVQGVIIDHIKPFLDKLREIGYCFHINDDRVLVTPNHVTQLQPIDVISGLEVSQIDADFEPLLTVLLTRVIGKSIVEDAINPQRHSKFIPQLNEMGANIEMLSNSRAVIYGRTEFTAGRVQCNEIRGGIALILAALSTKGISRINNVVQIDRGYEHFEKKLQILGASIERITV